MTRLIIYGDFNCPFSALASVRADALVTTGDFDIDWRAVQHDTEIPAVGEPVAGEILDELAAEVLTIREFSDRDVRLHLLVPSVRSSTAAASTALAAAGSDADQLRRRLFAAVWASGANIGDPGVLADLGAVGHDDRVARRWQDQFEALPRPITPTLVLPEGYISSGVDALARLAGLAATPSGRP